MSYFLKAPTSLFLRTNFFQHLEKKVCHSELGSPSLTIFFIFFVQKTKSHFFHLYPAP